MATLARRLARLADGGPEGRARVCLGVRPRAAAAAPAGWPLGQGCGPRGASSSAPAPPPEAEPLDVGPPAGRPRPHRRPTVRVRAEDDGYRVDPMGLKYLIQAFQARGHEAAALDPLGQHQWRSRTRPIPELTPKFHGFSEADLDKLVSEGNMLWQGSTGGNNGFLSSIQALGSDGELTLREIVERVRATYCGTIGVEYMHISERRRLNWIRQRVETPLFLDFDQENMISVYTGICLADAFERFLGDKFPTTKRFGIEGGEAVIPGLRALVDRGADLGVEEFVIGMPHRGRLNVLVNVLGMPMPQMLAEFVGTAHDLDAKVQEFEVEDWSSAGDVKYHLGTSLQKEYPDHGTVTLTLEANPSHLGSVGPVTLGRTKAKQYYIGDDPEEAGRMVMPVIIHGDAAFAGQGVVYEAMQLSGVVDFNVGGTIHVIINNQVGFTTAPENARSTLYCSDLGKAFRLPIFHANGDDPLAVVRAFELAAEWRQDWGEDCIVDVICYRRFGHNESDNPEFTQPLLYREIKRHKRTEEIMAQRLVKDGHATADLLDAIKAGVWKQYEKDFEAARTYKQSPTSHWVPTKWQGMRSPNEVSQRTPTGVDASVLREIGLRLCDVPAGFELHGSLARILRAKRQRIEDGRGLDWATAESLAVGSLLLEGCHVRLTGQDVQRGTFSHRHCVVHDQANGAEYTFLNELHLGPQETFVARNSILSELAVLGFELGYSYESPNALSIWEAQFGDFANNAQVMIDQFVCSGEHKWLQQSALTMLLPHGYDGQGAEHSSCRLERFLQLCDDDEDDVPLFTQDGNLKAIQKANWQVMNLTTPANYFHALRQQLKRDFRKPLVLAAPKALLRHRACVSSLEDMGHGSSFQRLLGERDPAIRDSPEKVDRLIFCTGKIYFELLAARTRLGLTNVALVTVELIAPFPFDRVRDQMKLYSNVQKGDGVYPGNIIWCQEEPKNMGAWAYVRPRMVCVAREALDAAIVPRFVGRRAAAAPATGLGKLHGMEQQAIISEALLGHEETGAPRPTALLGHQT